MIVFGEFWESQSGAVELLLYVEEGCLLQMETSELPNVSLPKLPDVPVLDGPELRWASFMRLRSSWVGSVFLCLMWVGSA